MFDLFLQMFKFWYATIRFIIIVEEKNEQTINTNHSSTAIVKILIFGVDSLVNDIVVLTDNCINELYDIKRRWHSILT